MIVAVAMVRDEEDIIGYNLAHLRKQGIDHAIVADNLSTDTTREILAGFPRTFLTIIEDNDPAYEQSAKMTRLTDMATGMGADWVLPFDADELWYAPGGSIRHALEWCEADIIMAHGWDHLVTLQDGDDLNPFRRITYRQPMPQRLPKVCFRSEPGATTHYGNHDVFHAGRRQIGPLEYRHFQYRSLEHLTRKVRDGNEALEKADLHWQYGTHWRTLASLTDQALAEHWNDLCSTPGLVHDPAPYT